MQSNGNAVPKVSWGYQWKYVCNGYFSLKLRMPVINSRYVLSAHRLSSLGALSSLCMHSKSKKIIQKILAGALSWALTTEATSYSWQACSIFIGMAPSIFVLYWESKTLWGSSYHKWSKLTFKSPAWIREVSHDWPREIIVKHATPTAYTKALYR